MRANEIYWSLWKFKCLGWCSWWDGGMIGKWDLRCWICPLYSQCFSWGRGWLLGKAFALPNILTPGILRFTIKTCQKWGCFLQVCVNSGFFCWPTVKYLVKSYAFRVWSHFLYWGISLFFLNCFCNILEAVIEGEDWIVLDSLNNSLLTTLRLLMDL